MVIEEGGKRLTQDKDPPSPEQAEQIERLKRQLCELEAKAKAVREAGVQQRIDVAVAAAYEECARIADDVRKQADAALTRGAYDAGTSITSVTAGRIRDAIRARAAQAGR